MAAANEMEWGRRRRSFDFLGVSVIVPGDLRPSVGSLPDDMPGNNSNFKLIRVIANVHIRISKEEKQQLGDLREHIEFYVHYTDTDLYHAGGDPSKLKLAYVKENNWVVFPDLTVLRPYTGPVVGIARIPINDWPEDPPIAIGG